MNDDRHFVEVDEPRCRDRAVVGAKAVNLARLRAAGLPVPPFVVLPPQEAFAPGDLERRLQRLAADGGRFAVRSSSPEEDGESASFAGLLHSFLNVDGADLDEYVQQVRRSCVSPQVIAYRQRHGLLGPAPDCAVIVQRMLSPSVSGVAFGADPVTGCGDTCIISAVAGHAAALVDGSADGRTWRLQGTSIAVDDAAVDDAAGATLPHLTDHQLRAVAAMTRRAGDLFGSPQDVEWAIEGGQLWILQARPITAVGKPAPADSGTGIRRVWDNANISESYGGVTTPLTFSFAQSAYAGVYRAFCQLMGVPRARIEANDEVFGQMLGMFDGRVYYNLFSWYRLIALLPGYASNRVFMEQMMGVREPMPEEIVGSLGRANWRGRMLDRIALLRSCGGLAVRYATLERMSRRFDARVDAALEAQSQQLAEMRLDALAAEYQRLERALLRRWDAPLVNDFFTMICFGVLRQSAQRWAGPHGWQHATRLISGASELSSTQPARRIESMARLAASIPGAAEILCERSTCQVQQMLDAHPSLRDAIQEYMALYADRCMEELKLESPTVDDEPAVLWRSIGRLAKQSANRTAVDAAHDRRQAQVALNQAMRGRWLRRRLLQSLLRRARRHLELRESMRFQRTRVFGRVRRIVRQMGIQLAAAGRLDHPADVFYLTIDELMGFVTGESACADLRALADARRSCFERYAQQPAPPERFETRGAVHQCGCWNEANQHGGPQPDRHDTLQGNGCYPGQVRGKARRVLDPRHAQPEPGDIIVAERTDPGWVMLFPGAAGVLVQRGSMLSHSATLARELGIPTIVGIAGLMERVQDGDVVELDGAAGTVRIVSSAREGETRSNRRNAG